MADDPTINTEEFARSTEAAEELRRQVDLLKQTSDVLNAAAKAHADSLEKLSNGPAKDTSIVKRQIKDSEDTNKALKKTQEAISETSDEESRAAQNSEESNERKRRSSSSLSGAVASISKFITKNLFDVDIASKKMAESFGKDMAKMADASGAFLLQKGWKEAIDKFDNLTGAVSDIQKPFLAVRESALQMGMGFGQSFDEARSGLGGFHKAMAETGVSTMTLREKVTEVHKVLGEAFDPKEMTSNLDKLVGANKDFEAALTNTNAALLVAKAKGMDATTTAKMLADAHLYLGETAETAPRIFADIADATAKSGLHYSKVSSAVMQSASTLKMWGGTVRSVTPIFKAFSDSLQEGQKGLAPELLESYVSGIKNMSFATRAFIGMSTGGPGTSAIGAGLKQRDLMSKGAEGMGELSKNLIETITKHTGGKMITAQEAMENPELETAYKIQEDLLKQMLGVSEEQAMNMAPALKNIQENGLKATDDQKKLLNDMMKSGEKTAQETADAQLDATIKLEQTVQSNGQDMINLLRAQLKSMGGDKLLKKFDEAQRKMAKGETGAVGAIAGLAKGTPLEKPLADLNLAVGRMTKKETVTKEQREEIAKGQKSGMDFVANFTNRLAELKEGVLKGKGQEMGLGVGQINKIGEGQDISAQSKPVQKVLQQMFKSIVEEIKELEKKGKKLSREEAAKLVTLRAARSQVRDMKRAKTINLNQFEKMDTGGKDKEKNPMDEFIRERSAAAQKQFDLKKDMLFGRGDYAKNAPAEESPEDRVKKAKAELDHLMKAGRGRLKSSKFDLPQRELPIDQAQAATREAQTSRQLPAGTKPKPIEQEVFIKLSANKQSILIEVDEEKMRKQVPEVLANTE